MIDFELLSISGKPRIDRVRIESGGKSYLVRSPKEYAAAETLVKFTKESALRDLAGCRPGDDSLFAGADLVRPYSDMVNTLTKEMATGMYNFQSTNLWKRIWNTDSGRLCLLHTCVLTAEGMSLSQGEFEDFIQSDREDVFAIILKMWEDAGTTQDTKSS